MLVPALGSVFAAAMLLWAALNDWRSYMIPNWVSIALILGFGVTAALAPDASGLAGHVAAGAALFAVCVTFFALGLIGGGDAKLLAATALWVGPQGTPLLLSVMAITGGLLSGVVLARRRVARPVGANPVPAAVPYGVAIAAGGVAALTQQTFA